MGSGRSSPRRLFRTAMAAQVHIWTVGSVKSRSWTDWVARCGSSVEAGFRSASFTSTTEPRWPPRTGACFAQLPRGSSNTTPYAQHLPSGLSRSTVAAKTGSRQTPASTLKRYDPGYVTAQSCPCDALRQPRSPPVEVLGHPGLLLTRTYLRVEAARICKSTRTA